MSYDNFNCDYNTPKPDGENRAVSPPPVTMSNPPQYYPQQPSVLVTQPINAMAISVEAKPRWSWALTITSVLTAIFCSCLWGCLGVLQAVHSYIDHKSGDYVRSRSKRNCGWGFTIAGLVIGGICWIIFFVYVGVLVELITSALAQQKEQSSMAINGN